MRASLVDTGRQNAVESVLNASTVLTSNLPAYMPMGRETGLESKTYLKDILNQLMLMTCRQLGSLAGRVEEYEKLLRELSLRAGEHDQEMIQKALDMVGSASTSIM